MHLEGELEDVSEEEHEQGVGGEALGQDAPSLEDEHLLVVFDSFGLFLVVFGSFW